MYVGEAAVNYLEELLRTTNFTFTLKDENGNTILTEENTL
jgi:uncharacterized protein YegP (UPF0339 family)